MKNIIILFTTITLSEQCEKLIFVMTHFRHGARVPRSVINNTDKLREEWNKKEELTSVGERMYFLLDYIKRLR